MRKLAVLMVALLAVVALLAPAAQAQTQIDPSRIPAYFFYPLTAGKTYALSQRDTFPQPTSAGVSTGIKLAGAFLLTATITVADSGVADVYCDYRVKGCVTWTVALTDSIKSTDTLGTTTGVKEFGLRTNSVDKFAAIDGDFRIRVAWRATGQAARASAVRTYSLRLNWKP